MEKVKLFLVKQILNMDSTTILLSALNVVNTGKVTWVVVKSDCLTGLHM